VKIRASVVALGDRRREAGWTELPDLDLLAWFLAAGIPGERAWRRAAEIYVRIGSLRALRDPVESELQALGFSGREAAAFLAAREITRRASQQVLPRARGFQSSQEVFAYFRPLVVNLKKECFWVAMLDGKNRLQRLERISEGCLTRALVHPREVFRPAIREAAAGLLFIHNHPSGDPQPSQEDLDLTRRLVECGNVVGIRVLDHVIIGGYRYFSFADEGLLPAGRSG
jgi:DNA repair protein RadC